MVKLSCKDYGFECDFAVEGEVEIVLKEFGDHTLEEHGIEYGKEALMQFILRKSWLNLKYRFYNLFYRKNWRDDKRWQIFQRKRNSMGFWNLKILQN